MRQTDIAIAGGGLAGSTAAAMLGRAGFGVVLVDPHAVYPPDLRCEKLDGPQVAILRKTGLAEEVLPAGTLRRRILDRALRARWSKSGRATSTASSTTRWSTPSAPQSRASAEFIHGKVTAIANSPDRQTSRCRPASRFPRGWSWSRTGSTSGLRHALGMTREEVSPCHSITHRLRPQAGRPRELRLPGPDLLRRARRRPGGLHHAVSDRLGDARQLHGLSRHGRSVAARDAPAPAR